MGEKYTSTAIAKMRKDLAIIIENRRRVLNYGYDLSELINGRKEHVATSAYDLGGIVDEKSRNQLNKLKKEYINNKLKPLTQYGEKISPYDLNTWGEIHKAYREANEKFKY